VLPHYQLSIQIKSHKETYTMIKEIITEATDAVVAAIKGADDIMTAITSTVKNQVVNLLKGGGEVTTTGIDTVASVASGAMRGAGQVGTSVTESAKQVMHGAITGVSEVGGDVIMAAREAARGVIQGASETGGDIAGVAPPLINAFDGRLLVSTPQASSTCSSSVKGTPSAATGSDSRSSKRSIPLVAVRTITAKSFLALVARPLLANSHMYLKMPGPLLVMPTASPIRSRATARPVS
jgi:hypothetical protein